jgi:hypothetical protein
LVIKKRRHYLHQPRFMRPEKMIIQAALDELPGSAQLVKPQA